MVSLEYKLFDVIIILIIVLTCVLTERYFFQRKYNKLKNDYRYGPGSEYTKWESLYEVDLSKYFEKIRKEMERVGSHLLKDKLKILNGTEEVWFTREHHNKICNILTTQISELEEALAKEKVRFNDKKSFVNAYHNEAINFLKDEIAKLEKEKTILYSIIERRNLNSELEKKEFDNLNPHIREQENLLEENQRLKEENIILRNTLYKIASRIEEFENLMKKFTKRKEDDSNV